MTKAIEGTTQVAPGIWMADLETTEAIPLTISTGIGTKIAHVMGDGIWGVSFYLSLVSGAIKDAAARLNTLAERVYELGEGK